MTTRNLDHDFDVARRRVLAGILVALGLALVGLYATQLFSPLDAEITDSTSYLAYLDRMLAGDWAGLRADRAARQHPLGYAALLAAASAPAGFSPAVVPAVGLTLLAVGSACFFLIGRRHLGLSATAAWACVLLGLANCYALRFVAPVLSDVPYLGVSAAALALACAAAGASDHRRRWAWVAGAAALAVAAVFVRSVGVALLPALLLVAFPRLLAALNAVVRDPRRHPRLALAAAAVLIACIAAGAIALLESNYLVAFEGAVPRANPLRAVAGQVHDRLNDFGWLALNVRRFLVPVPLRAGVDLVGLAFLAAVAWALWRRRGGWGPVEVYLLAYAAIFAVWPYSDPRFFVPVLVPCLMLFAAALPATPRRPAVWIAAGLAAAYLAAGFYSDLGPVRRATSGGRFMDHITVAETRPAYLKHYGIAPPAADALDPEQQRLLTLLNRFEPNPPAAR